MSQSGHKGGSGGAHGGRGGRSKYGYFSSLAYDSVYLPSAMGSAGGSGYDGHGGRGGGKVFLCVPSLVGSTVFHFKIT